MKQDDPPGPNDRLSPGEVFNRAVELPAGPERENYLSVVGRADPDLRAKVEQLLANAPPSTFMRTVVSDETPTLRTEDSNRPVNPNRAEGPGTTIGHYKLLQEIDEGGMGSVFLAAQEEPVKRRVAVKIIKQGMDTRQVVARFEAERQALALMDHPNIAKVLDAGATDSGRPFFVMELVKGVPVDVFCDQRRLDTRQRLELFILVCHAIQHAHLKGIIHRDIKPSNVMVVEDGSQPQPKVIDFGIAKATTQKLTEKTLFTGHGQLVGTPAYMSPEQADFSGLDIDTRTDVYSLGVLLYKLLTGSTPFHERRFSSLGFGEMQRVILEENPETPSTRLDTLQDEESTSIARNRGVELEELKRQLKGDLDWIVLKALEKDRSRRYESASALALDIQRHLNDEVVEAAAPGTFYRFSKFARRHRTIVISITAVFAALLIGAIGMTALFLQARAERESAVTAWESAENQASRAEEARRAEADLRLVAEAAEKAARIETTNATALANFLTGLFEDADPIGRHGRTFGSRAGVGPNLTAREIIDRGAARLQDSVHTDPGMRAMLLNKIAAVYLSLGLFNEAAPLVRESLEIRERQYGPDHPKTAESLRTQGMLNLYRQEFDEAGEVMRRALDIQLREYGEDHPLVSDTLLDLGVVMLVEDNMHEAQELMRRALSIRQRHFGEESSETLACLIFLSVVETTSEVGLSQSMEAAQALQANRGADEFGEFIGFAMDAILLMKLGGEQAYERILQAEQKGIDLLGEDHVFLNLFRLRFSGYLRKTGRLEKSRAICETGIESIRKKLGNDSIFLTQAYGSLGSSEHLAGQHEQAAAAFREAIRIYQLERDKRGPETYARLQAECQQKLGRALNQLGRYTEAAKAFKQSVVLRRRYTDGESTIAPAGLVVALLSTDGNVISQGRISRNAARGHPSRAILMARNWMRAAAALESNNQDLSAEDQIVLDSLNLGALAILAQGINDGFTNRRNQLDAPEFNPLRKDKRFQQLVKRLSDRESRK